MTMTRKDLVRPNGVPLVLNDHEPKKKPMVITFTRWKVAGQLVKFDENTELLHIGDETLSAEDWVDIRGRIDLNFMRIQALKKGPEPDKRRPASDFLNANLHMINSLKRGKIKKTWLTTLLGWLLRIDYVVSKEELDGEDPW